MNESTQASESGAKWCGHFSLDINGNCMRCAHDAQRRADMAQAWDEGKATGFSRAMRYMSDEPGVDTNPPNPYRDPPTSPAKQADQ